MLIVVCFGIFILSFLLKLLFIAGFPNSCSREFVCVFLFVPDNFPGSFLDFCLQSVVP
jgi:hypothetical protein